MLDTFGLQTADDDFRAGNFHEGSPFKAWGARPPVPPISETAAATQTLQQDPGG
jgi:hypothetical protein